MGTFVATAMAGAARARGAPLRGARLVLAAALVGGCYYVSARLGLTIALVGRTVTPFWPPTGVALVGLLAFGRRIWPAITLAAFAVNFPITGSVLVAEGIAVGNTLAPLAAAALLVRAGFRPELARLRDALNLVFLGAFAAMAVSATAGTLSLFLGGALPRHEIVTCWLVWWTGDAMGVLVVAPFLLVLRDTRLGAWRGARPERVLEAVALFAVAAVAAGEMFWRPQPMLYALFPFVAWAAARFQQRGAAPMALLLAAIAVRAAVEGVGPFAAAPLRHKMIMLQIFNGSVALTSFLLAAITSEVIEARAALARAHADLEERVRTRTAQLSDALDRLVRSEARLEEAQRVAGIGSFEWDIRKNTVRWTDEVFRHHGLAPQSVPVTYETFLASVHPDDRERVGAAVHRAHDDRQPFRFEYRIVRADGAIKWLLAQGRVEIDEEGRPLRMTGTCLDIDELKRSEDTARRHLESESHLRQALELNDEVIQGLAVASYAFESGELSMARRAVERTLQAARQIVSGLLRSSDSGRGASPGDLVRERPLGSVAGSRR